MSRFRSIYLACLLGVALVLGQHAGLLHGLGHATEQLSHKPGTPAKVACDQCFACSQLSAGAPSTPPVCPAAQAHDAPYSAALPLWALAVDVVFHSRAPPVLS
jgi:hypothetical protein